MEAAVPRKKDVVPVSIWFVLISIFLGKVCAGAASVLFPVTLKSTGTLSNALIGAILSAETASIIILSPLIGTIIGKLGVVGSVITGSLGRIAVVIPLIYTDNPYAWIAGIFIYGISSNLIGIAYQTWIGSENLGTKRGLVMAWYLGGMSSGLALGPVFLNLFGASAARALGFFIVAGLSLSSLIPVIFLLKCKPPFKGGSKPRIFFIIRNGKKVMFGSFIGGVILWGVPAFMTIYGMSAGMTQEQAAILLTMFQFGGFIAGPLISFISDKFKDRHNVVILSFFASLLCSFFLPIAIKNIIFAYALLFIWGGAVQGVYSGCMTLLGDIFRKEDQMSASVAFTQVKAIGGLLGVTLIGLAMDWASSEGMVYVITFASIIYFTFALTQYKIE
ncbi:MAG: MFS transporter [Candidatus Riflebacteria bacterium]|nr:MFS transporter [Candidatus Riflebacteria bacterium]